MTWDGKQFSPGGSAGVSLPGQSGSAAGSKAVTVQDLINLGLIDPGVVSGAGTLYQPATTRFAASVASALEDAASSITLNSATLFKKMNGLAGVVIGSGGIAAYNSAGTATITIDPETGNVTLSGTITATAGAIGGWTIGATTLTGGNATLNSAGTASFGTGNNIIIISAVDATYRLGVGNATLASCPFLVAINGDTAISKLDATSITSSSLSASQIVVTNSVKTLVSKLESALSVSSAATLTTARTIGGTSFNGSANITVRALGITDAIPNTLDLQNPTITTGTGVATFDPNNKPASNSTNTWAAVVINGTGYFFPVWT